MWCEAQAARSDLTPYIASPSPHLFETVSLPVQSLITASAVANSKLTRSQLCTSTLPLQLDVSLRVLALGFKPFAEAVTQQEWSIGVLS